MKKSIINEEVYLNNLSIEGRIVRGYGCWLGSKWYGQTIIWFRFIIR